MVEDKEAITAVQVVVVELVHFLTVEQVVQQHHQWFGHFLNQEQLVVLGKVITLVVNQLVLVAALALVEQAEHQMAQAAVAVALAQAVAAAALVQIGLKPMLEALEHLV
jgi:hypothetical protein